MMTLDRARPGVAAQAVGLAQGALDWAIRYTSERQQFGQSVLSFQATQFKIADMATEIEAARQMVYAAAREGLGVRGHELAVLCVAGTGRTRVSIRHGLAETCIDCRDILFGHFASRHPRFPIWLSFQRPSCPNDGWEATAGLL